MEIYCIAVSQGALLVFFFFCFIALISFVINPQAAQPIFNYLYLFGA